MMETRERRPAVFLDRDGTINEQMGYINHIDRFVLLPGVGSAIRRLNEAGLAVVVVTNQSGLARGYFPPRLLDAVHEKMVRQLRREGARLDGIYVCPHHPEAREERYRQTCDCRKPRTGLIDRAVEELHLDPGRSFMVGDRWSDLRCGARAGVCPILVLTGYGRGDLEYIGPEEEVQPACIAETLGEAVDWILDRVAGQ